MLKETFNFVYFSKWLIFALYIRCSYKYMQLHIYAFQYQCPELCQRTSFSNIRANVLILGQNLRTLLPKLTMISQLRVCYYYYYFFFLLLGLSIIGFLIKIGFILILGLIFVTLLIYFILKLYILLFILYLYFIFFYILS